MTVQQSIKQRISYRLLFLVGCLVHAVLLSGSTYSDSSEVIIDVDYTLQTALVGTKAPKQILQNLTLVNVRYYSFDNKLHQGQLVIHTSLANDVKEIFQELEHNKYPIEKVIPIVKYEWSDIRSIADNNTSAFNYRTVEGTRKLSDHSFGRAIDVNPYQNPWVHSSKVSNKQYSSRQYNPSVRGTIVRDDICYKAFMKRGWKWGGNWRNSKDYQHFVKK
jgi:peptidoglycan LD-endopeptidase CwlK